MEFYEALFVFLSGAILHAFISKILGVSAKIKIYRISLINCLGITKFAASHAERFLHQTCEGAADTPYISSAVEYWKRLSILSLKNSTPPEVWETLGIKDWRDVEKLVKAVEKAGSE